MNLSIHSFYVHSRNIFNEDIQFFKSKSKIFLVVTLALGLIAICFTVWRNSLKKKVTPNEKNSESNENVKKVFDSKTQKLEKKPATPESSKGAFFKAIDLMFHAGTLDDRLNVDSDSLKPRLLEPYSLQERKIRHTQLKEEIENILPEHINFAMSYKDWNNSPTATLLYQAINEIKDATHRLEIVSLLLSKGADPTLQCIYCDHSNSCDCRGRNEPLYINSFEAARRTGDKNLENILQKPRKKGAEKFPTTIKIVKDKEKQLTEENKNSRNAYSTFHKLMCDWGYDTEKGKFNFDKSYQNLKDAIQHILPEDIEKPIHAINDRKVINHIGGWIGCMDTYISPLISVIVNIEKPVERREIVKLLLDKGANPRIKGYCMVRTAQDLDGTKDYPSQLYSAQYIEIDPLKIAQQLGDQKLVDLLNDAIKKLDE